MRPIRPFLLAVLGLALVSPGAQAGLPAWSEALRAPGAQPGTHWVLTDPARRIATSYDLALFALEALRRGESAESAAVLGALASVQQPDGGLPFSFAVNAPVSARTLVRAGAVAWAVYAAARHLDATAASAHREAIRNLAHRGAAYLLARRVTAAGDPREGLITGGFGRYVYTPDGAGVRESFEPGEARWAAAEHNLDAAFALVALGNATGQARYAEAGRQIAAALEARLWAAPAGQFLAGVGPEGLDPTPALDAASWGALFWRARGRAQEAELAYRAAEARYASLDPSSGARGHKPYAGGPVYESRALERAFAAGWPSARWSGLAGVWPEGTGGVALAACRLGERERAGEILADLAPLRGADGRYAGFSREVPHLFERAPAVAGTLWLAWAEAEAAGQAPFVWSERL